MKRIISIAEPTVLTIGNFDGVHTAHQKLIVQTKYLAQKNGLKSVICTFDRSTKGSKMIMSSRQFYSVLSQTGIDYLATLRFFEEIMHLSCEEFVSEYICKRFCAEYVVVGENFRFGVHRIGDVNVLKSLGKRFGFQVICFKTCYAGKQQISSTWLRELIESGKVHLANRYLYQPFTVNAKVKSGFSLGNQLLDYPTANLSIPKNTVSIPFGVYMTKTEVDGTVYPSITNVGYAPTYRKEKPTIETYIFDFSGNLYGKQIQVMFLRYLRSERKFASIESLKNQIQKDVLKCRSLHGKDFTNEVYTGIEK